MEIKLIRDTFTARSTTSSLYVGGELFCFCLEDPDRRLEDDLDAKIKGATAIPTGRYFVIRNLSSRFKKVLPLLLDVPGFEGVRIHPGNSPKDTEGCILPGLTRKTDWVGDSKKAFDQLDAKIEAAIKRKELISITIERKSS